MLTRIAPTFALLIGLASCQPATTPPTTTTAVSPTTAPPPVTTSTTVMEIPAGGWVLAGPGGIVSHDGTMLWPSDQILGWSSVARDGSGGIVFIDVEGLWWLKSGSTDPQFVTEVEDDLVEVVEVGEVPYARLGWCEPSHVSLLDGSREVLDESGRVESSCDEGRLEATWTAANGLSASVVGPETALDAEGQVAEILEPARLVVTRDGETLLEFVVGGAHETFARVNDFDGRLVVVSRGPFEPALPEETFYVIDLSTGELISSFTAGATTVALLGPDSDWTGDPVPPSFYPFDAAPLVTDDRVTELEDGRYLALIDHAFTEGFGGGPELHFDLAVWFTGIEANLFAREDGETDVPVPNDYYIRNLDPTVLVREVGPEVEVSSVWYRHDEDLDLEPDPISFTELVAALDGEPEGSALNMRFSPWWVTIEDDVVVAIDEQYVP